VFISKSDHARQWVSYDTTTATSFQVVEDTAGKYSWYLSDSVFWKEEMRENVGIEHLLDVKDVTNGELHGKELLVKRDRESSNSRRVRILVCGDKVYKLFVTGGQDLLYSKDVNSFFDSFRTDGAGCGNSLTVSKAALLLHDLGSPDSATRRNAHSALIKAPFVKADAQLLREALFRTYQSPYGAFQATFINFQLATLLARLKDPMTLAYIRSSYDGLRKEKSGFQNTALFMLAQQHTTDSYALLAELLRQGPTAENLGFRSLFALKDSLDLTATLFPSFDSWARDSLQSPGIAYITMTLLDSGYLTQEAVAQQADRFIDAAKELLPTLSRSDVSGDMHMKSLIKLIGRCHTSSSYALLQSYLTVKNKSLLNEVVLQLVNGGQAVPAAVLNRLAADPVQRTVLYSDLKKSKKASLFPLVYRTQAYFAESAVYQAINDEDEDEEGIIEKLVFLSKRTAMYHGMNYTWYLYKVSLQNDEGTRNYLGIAGGYDLSGAGLEPKKELSGIYRKEEYDGAKVQSFFSQYLKSMDKDEEE
jgi:hypothetical protein